MLLSKKYTKRKRFIYLRVKWILMKLDLTDKRLLAELDLGARQSLGQLGRKLRLSKRGIDYKMKKLEKESIILGYKAMIDSSKLGYYYLRLLISFTRLDTKTREEFEAFIKQSRLFAYVFCCQGEYDYACTIWAKSILEFSELANHIRFRWKEQIK